MVGTEFAIRFDDNLSLGLLYIEASKWLLHITLFW